MEWFEVKKNDLPKDRQFLIYIEDTIGLCEWFPADGFFYGVSEPAYAYGITVMTEKYMSRITHWAELPKKPVKKGNIK